MSDLEGLIRALRGPEPPAEPPELPAEESEQGSGPGFLPLLLAAMVLLGIGVVTLAPDDAPAPDAGPASEMSASPDSEPAPAAAEEESAPAKRKTTASGTSASGGGAAPAPERDPLRCLAQYSVDAAEADIEIAQGGMVVALHLVDPRNPDLEGCLRRALLGTRPGGEAGTRRERFGR